MSTAYNQIPQDVKLSVEPIFKELMKASIGRGSIYLKAKETILDYVAQGDLDEREKASIITKSIAEMTTSITAQAMQAALKVAQENRDAPYALTKVREDTKLVTAQTKKLEKDTDKADKDIEIATMAIKKAQAELYRDFGVNVASLHADIANLSSGADFTTYGSKYEAIKMARANVYNTYATSYRQNGVVTLVANGTTGYLESSTDGDDYVLLTQQHKVAVRQEKAFDDNMRQHAANSSASMISMLLSTDEAVPNLQTYVNKWVTSLDYLNGIN